MVAIIDSIFFLISFGFFSDALIVQTTKYFQSPAGVPSSAGQIWPMGRQLMNTRLVQKMQLGSSFSNVCIYDLQLLYKPE